MLRMYVSLNPQELLVLRRGLWRRRDDAADRRGDVGAVVRAQRLLQAAHGQELDGRLGRRGGAGTGKEGRAMTGRFRTKFISRIRFFLIYRARRLFEILVTHMKR